MARVYPLQFDPDDPILEQVRASIGHLPQAHEEVTWGVLTLRIGRKLFGIYYGGPADSARTIIFKPVPAELGSLTSDDRFFRAPHLKTWLAIEVDAKADWAEIRELLTDSYAMVAPRQLAELVGGRP